MRSKLLTVVLALFIVFGGCAATKVPLKSILPFADLHPKGGLDREGNVLVEDLVHEMCTTWAVRVDDYTRWITAAHCIVTDEKGIVDGTIYKIGGKDSALLRADFDSDLALFSGPAATPLNVSFAEAQLGDEVYSFGYFWQDGIFTKGIVSVPNMKGKRIFNLAGGPGSSGAPIFTKDNVVVGLTQQGPCPLPCPVTLGASVHELRAFLYGE